MDYFEALKTSHEKSPEFYAHSPLPLPKANDVSAVIDYIKHTCDDLYFTGESDEPVELYQLSGVGLQMLESNSDKLSLPSAADFAAFAAGDAATAEEGFIAERRSADAFLSSLRSQQASVRQKHLAASLETAFHKLTGMPGTDRACYRLGIPPSIEVYVVMLIDGQVVGIKTRSVET
ncbi:hypothetical protein IWQ57_005600 [Coemansia nantahalensis]|uniref:Uncharacterized protein n=1 Tax=Coemansia nantahalensis TaxID=2789366 RepID=A0ACC1JMH6_9FUNG|nr:hypothetical protein IWQ57_005600 [Coemansia nantahalensis]